MFLVSGSVALLADTIHNVSDAFTSIPLWIAFVLLRRPPSRRFTYGLGRVEDLAGIIIVLFILASAVVVGWESIQAFADPRGYDNVWLVGLAGVIGFVGNEAVAVYRIRVGPADRLRGARGRRQPRPHRRLHQPRRRSPARSGSGSASRWPTRSSASSSPRPSSSSSSGRRATCCGGCSTRWTPRWSTTPSGCWPRSRAWSRWTPCGCAGPVTASGRRPTSASTRTWTCGPPTRSPSGPATTCSTRSRAWTTSRCT